MEHLFPFLRVAGGFAVWAMQACSIGAKSLLIGLLSGAVATMASAQQAGPIPAPVKSWLDEKARECRAARGRFSAPGDWYLTGDFNGDRVADYMVTVGGLDCETPTGMGPFAYGSAGPSNDFLISGPGGYRRFEGFMGELGPQNVQRRGDRSILVVERGAEDPNTPTRAIWGWNGSRMALLEMRNARGQVVDEGGRLKQSAKPMGTITPVAAQSPNAGRAGGPGFSVAVELTPAALEWYKRRGDQPVLLAIYQARPRPGAPSEHVIEAEGGWLMLGEERIPLTLTGGMVRVPETGLNRNLLRWSLGEPEVGLLIGHARPPKSSMDSERFLECTPDANPKLSVIRARGARLRCGPPAF